MLVVGLFLLSCWLVGFLLVDILGPLVLSAGKRGMSLQALSRLGGVQGHGRVCLSVWPLERPCPSMEASVRWSGRPWTGKNRTRLCGSGSDMQKLAVIALGKATVAI